MPITKAQTETLLDLVSQTEPDPIDCDGCFEHIADFVELSITNKEIPEALQSIALHLEQCPCCRDEHLALREGLQLLQETRATK